MWSESGAPNALAVIGLGKLGSPMAAVFAAKGFDVIGADLNATYVDAVNRGLAPVDEPQLQSCITAAGSRLRATTSTEDAVAASAVTFVIVPTPSQANHFFSTDFVVAAMERIGRALRGSTRTHLVVITSTVMPGDTGGVIRKALESASGRVVGDDLGLCYSPEFIALGSVVHDLLNPDMVLIGESDLRSGEQLEAIYRRTTESNPAVHRMNFVNAEICKIAVNTFVTTKISYANMLADLCDHLPDADVDIVSRAIGSDSRIGHKYLRGGVAYGGPCFPRDNKAFAALARALGVRCDLAEATDRINDHQVQRLLGAVQATTRPGARIGVLGLSYKLHTPVVEKSQGLALARVLAAEGYQVSAADPVAAAAARAAFGSGIDVTDSVGDVIRSSDAVVITTPWPEIRDVPLQAWTRPGTPLVVIDPWCLLQGSPIGERASVVALGRGGYRAAARDEAVSEVAGRG